MLILSLLKRINGLCALCNVRPLKTKKAHLISLFMKLSSINTKQMSSLSEYNSTNRGTFYSECSILSVAGMDFSEVSLLSLWVMSDTLKFGVEITSGSFVIWNFLVFITKQTTEKSYLTSGKYWPTTLQQIRPTCPLPEPSFWEVGLMNNLWCKRGLFKSPYQGFWFFLTLQNHRSEDQRFNIKHWIWTVNSYGLNFMKSYYLSHINALQEVTVCVWKRTPGFDVMLGQQRGKG